MPSLNWIKAFYKQHERLLVPAVLLLGVIVDFITFKTIEIRTAFFILLFYAVVGAGAVYARHATSRPAISSLLIQFTFGAILSASLVFYWFAGAFSVSWPLLVVVALLMFFNERARHLFLHPTVSVSVFYFGLFSLATLIFPFIANSIEPWVFVLGGSVSLVVIWLYIQFLAKRAQAFTKRRTHLRISVVLIYCSMNLLYFLGTIPPIPLSLQEVIVAHQVERTGVGYRLVIQQETLVDRLLPGETVFIKPGEPVYIYSSVFAPTDLNTTIAHRWEYFDEQTRNWIQHSRPTFHITGGRENGFRGYSLSSRTTPGLWRVGIETARGQVLGRMRFTIAPKTTHLSLETVER